MNQITYNHYGAGIRQRSVLCCAFSILSIFILACANSLRTAAARGPLQLALYSSLEMLNSLENSEIDEASGIAPSHLNNEVFWLHNDSGGDPALYAVSGDGKDLGTLHVKGAVNRDWEDMCSFTLDGISYLAVADTGNNFFLRESFTIYIIEEPSNISSSMEAKPSWTIEFRYDKTPNHDCESIAVDAAREKILIMTKRPDPGILYELPLVPENSEERQTAMPAGAVCSSHYIERRKPTAIDISYDGSEMTVLTRDHAYIYSRAAGDSWNESIVKQPRIIILPDRKSRILEQREGLCFGADSRTIYITTEGIPTQFSRLTEVMPDQEISSDISKSSSAFGSG